MIAAYVLMYLALQEPKLSEGEQRAVDRLAALGGSVRVEPEKPNGYEIWVDFEGKATDEAFAVVGSLRHVTAFRPMGGGFSDRGLRALIGHPRLWLLVARSNVMTDASLEPISRISGLKKLDIMGATLTSKGLSKLQRLSKLERLFLYGSTLTDGDCAPLMKLNWLNELVVPKTISPTTLGALRKALPKAKVSSI